MHDQEPVSGQPERRLSTREAAEFLGVKPETVYAYVSRGQLSSRRTPGGRGSTFDPGELAALARRTRRESAAGPASGGELSVRTRITLIEKDRYYFRGVDATELASHRSYEEIAEWLWTGSPHPGAAFTAPEASVATARRAVNALPAHSGPTDRLRVAAVAAAAADPLRFDLSEQAVLGTARVLIPTLVAALPPAPPEDRTPPGPGGGGGTERHRAARTEPHHGDVAQQGRGAGPEPDDGVPAPPDDGDEGPIARRLWSRLTANRADETGVRVLDTALGLLADHDLAASTLAVRVAASARAHAYAAVSAGLGVIEGPLHGAASGLAHRLLLQVLEQGSAGPVIAEELRAGRRIPGLGHRLYPGEDPRARVLFGLLEQIPRAEPALAAARDIVATTARHTSLHANVDLALAVLTAATGMRPTAGETIFAVARTAGWIAHALEEYGERPLRMRPSGHYVGPRPPQPMPG
ncbi:citrate/2-methylcitrate synthase [Streptomyces sp. MS06]|uniref:citrate/2-methylcitrate synthase n=1 Tax=Streptomyces sp. MS06 TaxID=3385974 RepID=UPI0039A105B7